MFVVLVRLTYCTLLLFIYIVMAIIREMDVFFDNSKILSKFFLITANTYLVAH